MKHTGINCSFRWRLTFLPLFLFFFITLSGCGGGELAKTKITTLNDKEAEKQAKKIREEVSANVELAEGLELNLWASEKLLADAIGIHVNHQGEAYVTVTTRSISSEFDIRRHPDWMIESISLDETSDLKAFLKRELAPENSEKTKSFLEDMNGDGSHDWRDLTVEKESIYKIEDTSGDGIADRSQLFIKGFHTVVTDVLGGVFAYEDAVYAVVAPDVWKLKDTDGDGIANEKKSLSHGYKVHIGFSGHGMSGIIMGPDGRLYWGIGDFGVNIVTADGDTLYYPNQGVILRSEPDGSNLEVFAAGVRNTHEFTFDEYGNLIGVDNDGDHPGEYERVVYLLNGSDSGWRASWQYGKYVDPKNNNYNVWMEEDYFKPRFETQAAHILPPIAPYHAGPAGMAYNPGTALGEKWKDHFFIAEFTGSPASSAIHAFTLEPKGASFELATDQPVVQGILGTGLDFGPDGSLYIVDWITGWNTDGKGRIWKLNSSSTTGSKIRQQTQKLLAADFDQRDNSELLDLLKHPDMRVRKKAQFELAERGAVETLVAAIEQTDDQLARVHGIWGIWQLARDEVSIAKKLVQHLDDPDPKIRAQAAKVLGDVGYKPAAEELIPLLKDKSSRVRLFAAQALGQLKYHPAIQPIVAMLDANNDEDVYLRIAGAIALARIGDAEAITALHDHPSEAVRIAAVVALGRLEYKGAAKFLHDESEFVVTNAARAINDDAFIKEGLPDLARMLEQDKYTNEPLIRRSINANLYVSTPAAAKRLATFAAKEDADEEMRIEALLTLSVWPHPSTLDRVTGRYRGEIRNDTSEAHQAIAPVIDNLLTKSSVAIQKTAIKTVSRLAYQPSFSTLFALLQNDQSAKVRTASLKALKNVRFDQMKEAIAIALDDSKKSVRMVALKMIPESNIAEKNAVKLLASVLGEKSVVEQQSALQALGTIQSNAAYAVLDEQLSKLMKDELMDEIKLDLINAVKQTNADALHAKLKQYQASKPEDDPIADYRATLWGGNIQKGKKLFNQHKAAQCTRCHAIGGKGGGVGPDLSNVANRLTREQMLQSLIHPSAQLAPGFGVITVVLEDGKKIQGTVKAESDTQLTLRTTDGENRVIAKAKIAERNHPPSAMFPMGEILTKTEIRNIIAFLSTLKN